MSDRKPNGISRRGFLAASLGAALAAVAGCGSGDSGRNQIRAEIEDPAILLPPEYEGRVTVARFDQYYSSSNFRDDCKKLRYWRKGLGGW